MSAAGHEQRAHAYLSCSSSERWLNCTVAPSLEAKFSDEASPYALEGTKAHELAEAALMGGFSADDVRGDYSREMRDYVQMYIDYARGIDPSGHLMVEQRLDVSSWVPECFGTSDAVIVSDSRLHIADLKYGKGLRVDTERNSQLMLYALGAWDAYDCIYGPFETVVMHIAQPRLDHYSSWEVAVHELLAWGESIKPIARMAFNGEGTATAGDHCQFCKARHTCRARAERMLTAVGDMTKGDHLSDDELSAIYPRLGEIVKWANDLESYCLARVEGGTALHGLKLVEGRSVRRWVDDLAVVERLTAAGYDPGQFSTTKIEGITAIEKLVGKKKFSEVLGDLVVKPPGKPTLVPVTDERPEISNHDLAVSELLSSPL